MAVESAGPYASLHQTDNHTSTPPLSFFTGWMPFLPPNQQCQSTGRLSNNKPFFIWLLAIKPHLKYVTTVPCNLSLIITLSCDCCSLSDTVVSSLQYLGIVVMHMRCDGIFNKYCAANLLENLTVNFF